MYIAELKGKLTTAQENMEDILTSNVFSFFKYARRDIFLTGLLNLLGLEINPHKVNQAEFIFWPSYEDGTEPDLVIITDKYYLLFEAKLSSDFGYDEESKRHQLIREIEGGKLEAQNLHKEFLLIAITAHYSKHQFLADIANYHLPKVEWINWHQIARLIENTLESTPNLDQEIKDMATDLYMLLIKKKLRIFSGPEVFNQTTLMNNSPAPLFFDSFTAEYRGDFIGFLNVFHDFPLLQLVEGSLFLDLSDFEQKQVVSHGGVI